MDWFTQLEIAALNNEADQVRLILATFMSQREFLSGPGSDENRIDIDPVFAKRFDRVQNEALSDDVNAFNEIEYSARTQSCVAEGYSFFDVESGVALQAPDGSIVGGYFSCDISLHEEHQGLGLGTELVIEYFLRQGQFPNWELDNAAYSPAGHAAHCAAFSRLQNDPEMVMQKIKSISSQESPMLRSKGPQ